MYDLIVVGGGPAGLTAAIYAIRKRLNVLLISKDLGGKTNYQVEFSFVDDYQAIRGVEIVDKFKAELEYFDFARLMTSVERVTQHHEAFAVHTTSGEELIAKSVVIASGAGLSSLDVPGEKEFLMRGLAYSALSYAPLFMDRTAVVVGDGDLALRSTAELSTVAQSVHLIGSIGESLESALGQKLQSAENVAIFNGYQVTEIRGSDFAEQVVAKGPDNDEVEISADGIFIETDLIPNSEMVADLVDLDSKRRIRVDARNRTSMPGVFAAGDVTNNYTEQVLVAIGEGVKAALSAYEYLLVML